jgi:hypothetical protein
MTDAPPVIVALPAIPPVEVMGSLVPPTPPALPLPPFAFGRSPAEPPLLASPKLRALPPQAQVRSSADQLAATGGIRLRID